MAMPSSPSTLFRLRPAAWAAVTLLGVCSLAPAQPTEGTLSTVTVRPAATETLAPSGHIGLGDVPVLQVPASLRVVTEQDMVEQHVRRLSDIWQLDASAADAYNAIGYWDHVTLRGFVLDQNQNHRRDGMPMSAETFIGLENRATVDLLKGTSGIQAGTSAPGGLVQHTLKRPTEEPLKRLRIEGNTHGNRLAHLDLGGRFGAEQRWGYRVNVAGEDLSNPVPGADGHRHLAAVALDWRVAPGRLLEVELESSRRRQPSVPGVSLTGATLPAADPFINLNRQAWSQPTDMQGNAGSLKYTHSVNANWHWQIQAASQRLTTDDFLAYPYGCYEASTGTYFSDRYCPNGDVDLYDYRSLNERRRTDGVQWRLNGEWQSGTVRHHVTGGVLRSRYIESGQPQADGNAAVGTANLYTLIALPADPTFSDPYTNRREYGTEWFATDRIQWSPQLTTWIGARHTVLDRASVRTDGSRATRYRQSFTTPWLAASWQSQDGPLWFASLGQGVESRVAPGRSRYTNAGQALPALRSRQWEVGAKHSWSGGGQAQITWFHIVRPRAEDAGACDLPGTCTLQMDGDDRHQGLEASVSQRWSNWHWDASAMWLSAQRRHSTVRPDLNGQRPTNVPSRVLRAGVQWQVPQVTGLTLRTQVSAESTRRVTPDGSVRLPGWARLDAGLTYRTSRAESATTWRLTVQNVTNRRFFKEAPFQYGHVYLFPAAPRTIVMGVDWAI